jgi:hypothetical protein
MATAAGGRGTAYDAEVETADNAGPPERDLAEEARCLGILADEADELLAGARLKVVRAEAELKAAKTAVVEAEKARNAAARRALAAAKRAEG